MTRIAIHAKNSVGGIRMLVPIQVLGANDGTWNKAAWQTGAFYANPLDRFSAQ